MNYIKRNLENVVSQVTKEYPVVLVTGQDNNASEINGRNRKRLRNAR